jgi:hypothetical protein
MEEFAPSGMIWNLGAVKVQRGFVISYQGYGKFAVSTFDSLGLS